MMAYMANILADLATNLSAEESVIEIFDDDVIFVSTTTPDIVDLCSSPQPVPPENNTQLRNTRYRRTAGASRMVRHMALQIEEAISTSAALGAAERAVETTNSSQRHRIDKPNIADNGIKAINCAVCLENSIEKRPTSTICGHIFCEQCIKMAITQNKKCPLCKQKLLLKSIHPIYF